MDTTQYCPHCEGYARWAAVWKRSAKGWRYSYQFVAPTLDNFMNMLDEKNRDMERVRQICKQELAINDKVGGRCGGYKRILAVLDVDE